MTKIITLIITLTMCVFATAAESASIKDFLATRPSYKKIDLPAYEKSTTQYNYDTFFCDSAYKSERGYISITVLVRSNRIMGYHIQVTYSDRKNPPLGSNDIEGAIKKVYSINGFEKMTSGTVGIDNEVTHNLIYINKKQLEEARLEEVMKLSEKLKP